MENCGVLLRKSEAALRAYCKKMNSSAGDNEKSEWCCDNYGTLAFALSQCRKYIKRKRSADISKLFFSCLELCPDGKLPLGNNLLSELSELKLSLSACESLPVVLPAALAYRAVLGIKEENRSLINAVQSLNALKDVDYKEMFYKICKAERLLYDDPADIYDIMTNETKSLYRKAVSKGAAKAGIDEIDFLTEALNKAKKEEAPKNHIGFYLGLNNKENNRGVFFLAAEIIISLLCSVLIFIVTRNIFVAVITALPLFEIIKVFSNPLVGFLFPVKPVFSLDCENPRCPKEKVLITVSTVLPEASKIKKLYSHLEELYISDYTENTKVLLLCDLKGGKSPESPTDKSAIKALERLIESLNCEYPNIFSAVVRDRIFSPTQNEYTGFERKRGALCSLVRYIKNGEESFRAVFGNVKELSDVKYMLALDSDTLPSFDVINELRAAALHPLNIPVINKETKKVVSGYGCYVPQIKTKLESARSTFFTLLMGEAETLQYSGDVPERYMDMFGESIFTGKGLIDIDVFYETVTDSFENEYILSHDILEGDSMRVAFCGRQTLYDSVPSKPVSYFSRSHRWIRGDTQNLKYVFCPLRKDGIKKLSALTKYQLLDNFRRAVSPVFALLCVFAGVFTKGLSSGILIAAGILSVSLPEIINAVKLILRFPLSSLTGICFSAEISAALKAVLKALLAVGMLPFNAVNSADGIIRSFFRMFISHKNLLQWTTASEAESSGGRSLTEPFIFPVLSAVFLYLSAVSVLRLCSFLIIICALFSLTDGIKLKNGRSRQLSEHERENITAFCAASWRFFSEFVTAEENFLPPDNVQETPVFRVAHRTSPTNIGLYLCSVLAAADMSFINENELFERINNTLDTIVKLQKWNGNLLNWYNTKTMEPLKPLYVSTVDCGNFNCCLVALREGLFRYANEDARLFKLCERIDGILDSADLTPLYNSRRKLFHIGIDAETETLSPSFYDLYMSEARMTSYYEVAKRNVPVQHWKSLGRTLLRSGFYTAAASWTGTMFEYFMPAMFMPVYDNSFQYEALRVCLDAQKRYAAKRNIPYGISESCFYAFDSSLNYKYKAHGIKKLALKRGADEQSVISPYSTFLTLPFDKKSALKNLSRLSALHCEGRCGFYEAVDFSERNCDGDDCFIVRSYMSHHVGMSIVSAANILFDGIFINRFMNDSRMRSASALLSEAMPSPPGVFKGIKENGEKRPARIFNGKDEEVVFSGAAAFSNGELTLVCDKYGRNTSFYGGVTLYKYSERSRGIFAGIECGGSVTPFNFTSSEGKSIEKRSFSSSVRTESICADFALCVHPTLSAMLLPVRTKNLNEEKTAAGLIFYFEPELFPSGRENPHSAFSDMFIECIYDKQVKALVFTAKRSGENREYSIACGFYDRRNFSFCNDREKVLPRMKNREFPLFNRLPNESTAVNTVFPCAGIYSSEELRRGETKEAVFIVAAGGSREEALMTLINVRKSAAPRLDMCAKNPFAADFRTAAVSESIMSQVFFGGRVQNDRCKQENISDKNALWAMGISGDNPIITVYPEKGVDVSVLRAIIKLQKRFIRCGIKTDTVFLYENGDDYFLSGETTLRRALREEDVRDEGAFHIVSACKFSEAEINTLLCVSAVIFPGKITVPEVFEAGYGKIQLKKPEEMKKTAGFINGGFRMSGETPAPWCHTLSNKSFGTLVSNTSLGFSWALNAKLNPITPRTDNTSTDFSGEMLVIQTANGFFDCLENAEVTYRDTKAVFVSVCGDYKVETVVEVPERGMKKRVTVSVTAKNVPAGEVKIYYFIAPLLYEDSSSAKYIKRNALANGISFSNPFNTDFKGAAGLFCTGDNVKTVLDAGNILNYPVNGFYSCVISECSFFSSRIQKTEFVLAFAKTQKALLKLWASPFIQKKELILPENSAMPSLTLFARSLLLHQAADTRLLAKTGFYQCSGAFGFRDQLQDAGAVINYCPQFSKEIILKMCAAQFLQGDVLHWFHPVFNGELIYKGVRTRCSDDLLWLPFTVFDYIEKTGDKSILDTEIPFLEGDVLSDGEKERYAPFRHGKVSESVYSHCLLAIKKGLNITGRGLMKISGGDWNDSFNELGLFNDSESVWLTMFMRSVCLRFSKICRLKNDKNTEKSLNEIASSLAAAIDKYAWNGEYYVRGFFPDGTPFGDKNGEGFEIDLLCQAWASLSDMPVKERRESALRTAFSKLADEENGIIKLYSPALTKNDRRFGYANDYPSGVRENGGQYTHAAVWFLMALKKEGLTDLRERAERLINPAEKYKTDKGVNVYKTEPYALCGDVYSAKDMEGRGGWSLYTGSAGWFLRYYAENE